MSFRTKRTLIVLVGPTAVGKTSLAVKLAKYYTTVVLNADSRQVFKEMEIGTAKPRNEEMDGIKHYFVNDRSLKDKYSAGIFEREALQLLERLFRDLKFVLLSGGSGLYINAVCEGFDSMPEIEVGVREDLYEELEISGLETLTKELSESDPQYFAEVDVNNPQRVLRALEIIRTTGQPYSVFRKKGTVKRPFETIKIGIDRPREELYAMINARVDAMISKGLFDEVENLLEYRDLNAMQTVGYQEILGYLDGDYDKEEAIRLLKRNTRRFAKRQLTWFRKDQGITWFHPDEFESILKFIQAQP